MRNTPHLQMIVLLPLLFALFQPSPPVEQHVVGTWQLLDGMPVYYEFKRDHTIVTSFGDLQPQQSAGANTPEIQMPQGKWAVNSDGTLHVAFFETHPMTATLKSSLMLINSDWVPDTLVILQKLDAALKPLPYKPGPNAVRTPLFDVSKVQSVAVHELWWGLSPIAPVEATYMLTRTSRALSGTVLFSVGHGEMPLTQSTSIRLNSAAANTFLRKLAATPVEAGRYMPAIAHTDDYPRITMTVTLSSDVVVFSTQSQGQYHIPWAAQIKGKQYVVFSNVIGASWQTLDASLARDIQTQLIKTAEGWK